MSAIDTVLFDLDGTLIDTAPDMAGALEKLCIEESQATLDYDIVRPQVSNGSVALVRLAFGEELSGLRLEQLKQRFLELYEQTLAERSGPFNGMPELLSELQQRGIRWGVVTNKPGWLTLPLMDALGLADAAACIVSGDTTEHSKPHPAPMHHACELSGTTPQKCIYIGDAERDIEAGRRAGMRTVIAKWGYIDADHDIDAWQADHHIDAPADIVNLL